jgi:glycosyltransferase EpsE
MNNTPLISIIMGIYNCADTLEEAIQSIISQTYKNWELIMCDDGSRDDTFIIAQKYVDLYPNKIILLKNQNNLGLNKTLNKCLAVAKGEFIARMDGDDLSCTERLEKEFKFLNNHPEFALVSSPMIYFDENGEWGRGHAIPEPQIRDFVFHAPCFCHAPVMIRKSVYDAVGGYTEDIAFLRFEDCNLWYKIYAAGFKGANLLEPLYSMRDDQTAYKRRTVSTRLKAIYVQWRGFRLVNMKWYYYPMLIKDLLKGVILSIMPQKLYLYLHHKKQG